MSRIAACNRVLYFEPGRNPDRPVGAELARNLPNFFALHAWTPQENLIVVPTPSSLPVGRRHLPRSLLQMTTPAVARINAEILAHHIRRVTRALGVAAPILWLYNPYHAGLAGQCGEKLVCYFNYDEYANFVHNARVKELIRRYDDGLTARADVVFATSRAQWQQRKIINPATYFTPNGVDFALFNRALDPATVIPADVARLHKPVIGYLGWLGYQIDLDLLLAVAEACPTCSLALVGPDDIPECAGARRLRAQPNVHFLGRKAQADLPAYLKAMDVALIPYVLEGYTLTAYPLKLHEYLAAGRAIVATALPELRSFCHVVRMAETRAEFVCQVRAALQENGPPAIAARIAVARENTWDRRVADVCSILDERLLDGRSSVRGAQL